MKQNTISTRLIAEQVEKHGVAIFDITRMPVYDEPIVLPYVTIALVNSGYIQMEYDFDPIRLERHDFTLLSPDHILKAIETSEDFHVTILFMSHRFYAYLAEMYPDNYKYVHYYQNSFHYNELQYDGIKACMQVMKKLCTVNHQFRDKLLSSQLDIMAHLTEIYCTENGFEPKEKNSVQQLMLRFHTAVAENYHRHRDVKFYADLLCLSPKYFGTIVRQTLGYSAGELIARYVMVQAKHLLLHHRKMTIQQISDRLGFPDQTAFARYFKSHTGQTPQEFRA